MGRRTFQSILEALNHPLKDRVNIVLSRDEGFVPPSTKGYAVLGATSVDAALKMVRTKQVFFIGGVSVYEEVLEGNLLDTLMITEIVGEFRADTFFPTINQRAWNLQSEECPPEGDENPFELRFKVYRPKVRSEVLSPQKRI